MWLPTLPVLCAVLLFTAHQSSADPDISSPEGENPPEPREEGEEQCTAERHAQGLCSNPEHSPPPDVMNDATELGNEAPEIPQNSEHEAYLSTPDPEPGEHDGHMDPEVPQAPEHEAPHDEPQAPEHEAPHDEPQAPEHEATYDEPLPTDPPATAVGAAEQSITEAAKMLARQGEAEAVGAAPQDIQPAMPPPDVAGDMMVPPPEADATPHAQAEQAMPHMDQRLEEPVQPPPTTTAEPWQQSSMGGVASPYASTGVGMPRAESVPSTAASAQDRSNPSTTAEPKSELPGWVFGVNTDWKGAVVAVYGVTRTLSQWLGSLAGDVLQAATNLANAEPPLNIIIAIFAMFLAVLVFFRSLPSATVTSSGASPTQRAQPVAKPPPAAASAESTAALMALRQQVEEVQRGLQYLGAELRQSVSENGQGVERLAAEIRSFQQERIAIDAEILLSAKEILEWVSDSDQSGGAASTNGLSMAAGCPQSTQPPMPTLGDQHQSAQAIKEFSAGPGEGFAQQAPIAPVTVPSPPERTAPVPVAPVTISSPSEPVLPAQDLAKTLLPKVAFAAPAMPQAPPVPEAGEGHSWGSTAQQSPSPAQPQHVHPPEPQMPELQEKVTPAAPATPALVPPVPEASEGLSLGSTAQLSPSPAQPQHVHPPEPQMPELQEEVKPAAPATPALAPPVPEASEGLSLGSTAQLCPSLAQPQHVHHPEPQMPELQEKAEPSVPVLNPAMGGRPAQQPIQAAGNPFGARPKQQPIQAAANPFGRPQPQPIQAAANPFGARPQQQPIQAASNPFGPR